MLPKPDFAQSWRPFSTSKVTKAAVLGVVSQYAGLSGRVNPERVWRELQGRGFCSSRKAVAMTLHRCSIQGLLKAQNKQKTRLLLNVSEWIEEA